MREEKNILKNLNYIIAIAFVIFLILKNVLNMDILYRLDNLVYMFIIPFFIYSMAKVLKSNDSEENKKFVKRNISIYLIIELVLIILKIFIDKEYIRLNFLTPSSAEWLFFTMPIYLMICENLDLNNYKNNIVLFTLVAIISSFLLSVDLLLIIMLFAYLPFFIMGYCDEGKRSYFKIGITFLVFLILEIVLLKFNSSLTFIASYENSFIEFTWVKIIMYGLAISTIPIMYAITLKLKFLDFEIKFPFFKKENKKQKEKKKNTNIVSKFLTSDFVILIFIFSLIFKTVYFYKSTVFGKDTVELYTVYYNLYYIILLSIPLVLIRNGKTRFIVMLIENFIISAILFADNLYYDYSHIMISINQIANLKYVREITDTSADLFKIQELLYFIDIIFLIVIAIIFKVRKTDKKSIMNRVIASLMLIYISSYSINFDIMVNAINAMPYNNVRQVTSCSIYGYHLYDIVKFINIKSSLKYKNNSEMEKALKEVNDEYKSNYVGIAKGKNIILVQFEALQNFLYHLEINGEEITPNINKFIDENIYVSNMHAQSYTTTADAEFSTITSLYPLDNGLSFSKYYNANYYDVFSKLQENNYYTAFMHGNISSFWNRGNAYANFGMDKTSFIDKSDDEKALVMNYLSDDLLYEYAIKDMLEFETPFCINLVAASSHTPFTLEGLENKEEVLTIDVGKYKDTRFGNYLEAANFADIQFGKFVESLKQNDLYEDSIIFIYGDHYGMTMDNPEMLEFLAQKNDNNELNSVEQKLNFTNVLCSIRVPGVSEKIIDKPTSKIDVKPTILSILGIEDEFSIGTSIFSNKDYVSVNIGTIITEDKYFDSENWYYIDTDELVDMNELNDEEKNKLNKYVKNMHIELDISNAYPILNR